MGFKSFFKNLFTEESKKEVSTEQIIGGIEKNQANIINGDFDIGYNQKDFLNEIKGWSFSCINAIAENLAMIDIKLYKKTKDGVEEVIDSPIMTHLYMVNDYTTKFDHFWLTAAYLEAVGEAPWFLDKDEQGNILGIYLLNPADITPVADPNNERVISGYNFNIGLGKKEFIPYHQLILLKVPNPSNPIRGLGTMFAGARTIDIDNQSEKWNFNFFKNNASPGVKMTIKNDNSTKEQRDKLVRQIENKYKGVEKSQQLWVLFNDMEVEPFGLSQKDMDFTEQQKWTADKIRGIFRVPKAILAQTEGVNRASAKEARAIFLENTIKPKIERIVQQLNEFYIPQYKESDSLYIDYVNSVEENREMQLNMYENALKNGWMTINEVRENEGLGNLGIAGDKIYMPLNLIGLDTDIKQKQIKPNSERLKQIKGREKFKIDKDELKKQLSVNIKKMLIKSINKNVSKRNKDSQLTQEQKDKFWEIKASVFDRYFERFMIEQNTIFNRQEREVISNLKKQKDIKVNIGKTLLNKKKEADNAVKIFSPIISLLMEDSAEETFKFLGLEMSLEIADEEIQKYIKSRTIMFADATTETTNNKIKKVLEEGIKEGEGNQALSRRIAKVFTDSRSYRTDRIARSEVTRFNVEATERAYIQSEVVEAKEWIINPDACPICIPFNGKTVKLGDSFANKGDSITTSEGNLFDIDYETIEHPPLHPNCRCDIVPVLKQRKGIAVSSEIARLKKTMFYEKNFIEQELKKQKEENKEQIEKNKKDISEKTLDEVINEISKSLNIDN